MPTAIKIIYLPVDVDIEWHASCHRLEVIQQGTETYLVNITPHKEHFNVSFETYQSIQTYLGAKCVISFTNIANIFKVNNK